MLPNPRCSAEKRLLRKLITILLLATFALPFLTALSAVGETPESRLPVCCRRSGAHHCMMSAEEIARLEDGQHVTTIHSKCPLFPKATPAAHHQTPVLRLSIGFSGVLSSRPAKHLRTHDWTRVALEGTPHKRGPPRICLS
jgi:hypothetical protein